MNSRTDELWDEEEQRHELEAELIDFTRTVTWRRIMKPALLKRQEDISRKLCCGSKMPLEDIRELQVLFNFISQMTEDPIQFFSQRKVD